MERDLLHIAVIIGFAVILIAAAHGGGRKAERLYLAVLIGALTGSFLMELL